MLDDLPNDIGGAFDDDEIVEGPTSPIDIENNTLEMDLEKAKVKDAILIIIRGNPQGKKFVLNQEEMVVGRDSAAQIRINDANISRQHSVIRKTTDGFSVEDMSSRNGTFLNDQKLSFATGLNKEDMIKVGTTILKYIPAGEIEILYQDNMANAAYYDDLTRVFNRNYISQAFEAEFKRAKALHTSFPVILFDIDHFKKVNDTHGHDAGDFVLRELVNVVKNSGLHERELLGRWGGEEFVLLLSNSSVERAKDVAEKIRAMVENHMFKYDEKTISITISIGYANITKDHKNYIDLYKEADQALYSSKKNGRNQTTFAKSKD